MANPIQRSRVLWHQWRSWSKKEWTVAAAAALLLIVLAFSNSKYSSINGTKSSTSESRYSDWVPFTPLSNASSVKKGARK